MAARKREKEQRETLTGGTGRPCLRGGVRHACATARPLPEVFLLGRENSRARCRTPCPVNRKRTCGIHKSFKFLARQERFELPAYRFVACCSIQLSY